MNSTAQPRLPQEIFDIIIDNNPHDEEMHKTFALVSKSFLFQSRRHFFHDIRFYDDDAKCRALQARFWEILNANPDIAWYVRDVHIEDNAAATSGTLGQEAGDKCRPSWIREEETFQKILLVLAKNPISNFTLDTDLDWTSFPIGLQHALTQILAVPSLVNLDLSGLTSLPVSCCTHFRRLKQLRLSSIVLMEGDPSCQRASAAEATTVSISSLEVSRLKGRSAQLFCNFLALKTTGSPLAFLEELRIAFCDVDFTREVIWAVRKSLKFLNLAIGRDHTAPINLTDLESLNCLDLTVYIYSVDCLTGVLRILETGGPNKELCSMRIKVHHYSSLCINHFSHHEAMWRRIGTTLNCFSSLMDLVIEFVLWQQSDIGEEKKAELERSVRNGLENDAGNSGRVNKVLRVKISEL